MSLTFPLAARRESQRDADTFAPRGETLIAISGASVRLGDKAVLDQVSLDVHRGEIVTVIGPNGAGKTTLARVLLGLIPLQSGTRVVAPGLRIGYAPQRFPVDRSIPLTVARFMRLNIRLETQDVVQALRETNAEHLAHAQVADLSGGEFQRVLLARALARNPDFLVLDEPAQALDFGGAAQLYDLIEQIRRYRRCGILLISHDLHIVLGASDRVVCLNRHICCEGVPALVAGHPEYLRLFGRDAAQTLGIYRHRHDHEHGLGGDVICDHASDREGGRASPKFAPTQDMP
jgi:zinc transport system ATP-binding protein